MAESLGGSLAQGLQSGFALGSSIQEARERTKDRQFAREQGAAQLLMSSQEAADKRKKAEWEKDFNVIQSGIKLAEGNTLAPEKKYNLLRNIGQTWAKHTGADPFADLTLPDLPKVEPLMGKLNEIQKRAAKNPDQAPILWGEAQEAINTFTQNLLNDKETLTTVQNMTKGTVDYLKNRSESQQKKADQKPELSVPDALKRQTSLSEKMHRASQGIIFDDATGKMIDIKNNPKAKSQVMKDAARERNALNPYLPEEMRQTTLLQSEFEPFFKSMTPEKQAEANKLLRSGKYTIAFDL